MIVKVNPQFYRPAEADLLCGNAAKAERQLGWRRKISFSDLVAVRVESDERRAHEKRILV